MSAQLASNIRDLSLRRPACVTIGNFDGVHCGHVSLINQAQELAREHDLDFILMTFWPHPREVLPGFPGHTPLTEREQRLRLLANLDIEYILEIPFTAELAAMSAENFVRSYLLPLDMKFLAIGHDFSLGHAREGGISLLLELGTRWNFNVKQISPFLENGTPISSTRLRKCIKDGEVRQAARLLGRYHSVSGTVAHGYGRGSSLGFPTANLENIRTLLPANGVYATFAIFQNKHYKAVTNIGTNPTFQNDKLSVESFLLDARENFYEHKLTLEFVERLRPEKRFESSNELSEQIARDVALCRQILKS